MSTEGLFISPTLQSLHMVMDETALRQQAISSNIANLNTPGYQRVDVSSSFQQSLSTALNRLGRGESAGELPAQSIETAQVQGPARPDGNTVQVEQEMIGLTQNSARYEFAAQMMASQYHGIKYAITGQNP